MSQHDRSNPFRPQDLTRAAFLRRMAAAGLAGSTVAFLAACGDDDSGATTTAAQDTSDVTLADLGAVGGAMQVITYAGYEGGDAIKPWLKRNDVDQQFTPINNQDDVTTKLRSAAGRKAEAVQLGVAQVKQYQQLGLTYPLQKSWLPNVSKVEPYFLRLTTDANGALTSVPFVWGALGANYDPKRISTIESWQELTDPKFKDRVAMIDDPVSTVQTGALAIGIKRPETMTRDQLEQVKEFLVKVKANAKTVAAGYADIGDLIVAGDVWTSFQGWNAVEIFAAAKNGVVKTAYPKEGTVGFVDTYFVPKESDNKGTAVAFINEMLSERMQTYVGTDLASGLVIPEYAKNVEGVGADVFDYDDLEQLFRDKFVFALDAPLESDGDIATHDEWVQAWEDVKAT